MTTSTPSPFDPSFFGEDDISRVYLTVLGQAAPTRASVIEAGHSPALVDHAIEVLHLRGFINATDPDLWEVAAPDIALPAWAADVERRARAWRATASTLNQLYQTSRAEPQPDSGNRELGSLADVASATATIVAVADRDIFAMRATSRRTVQLLMDPISPHAEGFHNAAGELLRPRAVYDASILDVDGALEALQERAAGGELVRLATGIQFTAIVVDDSAAVVEFSNIEPSGAGSMLVRSRPFVRGLTNLIDSHFTAGLPLPGTEEAPMPDSASGRDALILSLLASGASDSTITRRLRISQRTVERRVRVILDRLGAETRFQAGVEAARQGLV